MSDYEAGLNIDIYQYGTYLWNKLVERSLEEEIRTDTCDPKPITCFVEKKAPYCRRQFCKPQKRRDPNILPESFYTTNLAAQNTFQMPLNRYQVVDPNGTVYVAPPRVNWNQMSDRAVPHHSTAKVASGTAYHVSSVKHSITRLRPGACAPGGTGVDIKHNSYNRYLNRLKGANQKNCC